jgi:hypothetical protein
MAETDILQDINLSAIKFPVHTIAHGTDLLHKYPELATIDFFQQYPNADRNYVIRYIIYLYDPAYEMQKKYLDLKIRKEKCSDLAGFERNDSTGKFKEAKVYKIMLLSDIEVGKMIFAFLKYLNNREWSQIVVNEQIFEEYTRLLMKPIDGDDDKKILEAANVKSKLREECKTIIEDLDKFYKLFYGDDPALKNTIKKKPVRPETMIL